MYFEIPKNKSTRRCLLGLLSKPHGLGVLTAKSVLRSQETGSPGSGASTVSSPGGGVWGSLTRALVPFLKALPSGLSTSQTLRPQHRGYARFPVWWLLLHCPQEGSASVRSPLAVHAHECLSSRENCWGQGEGKTHLVLHIFTLFDLVL